MSKRKTMEVDLASEDAAELSARAAMQGVETKKFLGYHVCKSAFGALHPEVIEFETGADQGRPGTNPDSDKQG